MNVNYLSESIQLAVAPVFLLTAVAGMITALTQRLARVIDRSRQLQDDLTGDATDKLTPKYIAAHEKELKSIAKRGRCINVSMVLLVLCAIQIGVTVLELFFAENFDGKLKLTNYVFFTFVGGIASFIFALIALLYEIYIASYSIRWKPHTEMPQRNND